MAMRRLSPIMHRQPFTIASLLHITNQRHVITAMHQRLSFGYQNYGFRGHHGGWGHEEREHHGWGREGREHGDWDHGGRGHHEHD